LPKSALPFGNAIPLAEDAAINVDARGFFELTVLVDDGATLTASRIDSMDATEHSSIYDEVVGAAEIGGVEYFDCDWPYFRISVVGGDARWALVTH
jgi:hypothetical protein